MLDDFAIFFQPLDGPAGTAAEQAGYAEIGLKAGEQWLTLLEDRSASTVSPYLRGDVHQLAMWFASNWWRLRWEPDIRDWSTNVDWRMAHSVSGAGGGYVWPNVLFASDGDTLALVSRPRTKAASFEPVRYLTRYDGRISATEFENTVDNFLEDVTARFHRMGIRRDPLAELWAGVGGTWQCKGCRLAETGGDGRL